MNLDTPLRRAAHNFVAQATGRVDLLVKVKESPKLRNRLVKSDGEFLLVYDVWTKEPGAKRGRMVGCLFAHTKNRRCWI